MLFICFKYFNRFFEMISKMYCSKECFVTKNIFTRRYEVFDYEEPKSYERRIHFSLDNCVKYNKNEKNELNNNKA